MFPRVSESGMGGRAFSYQCVQILYKVFTKSYKSLLPSFLNLMTFSNIVKEKCWEKEKPTRSFFGPQSLLKVNLELFRQVKAGCFWVCLNKHTNIKKM